MNPLVLARIRDRHRLSQSKLSELIGLNHSTVSRWESGERLPRRHNLEAAARVMQLSAADTAHLMTAFGYTHTEEPFADEPVIQRAYLMIKDDGLPLEARERLRALIASGCLLMRHVPRKG